MRILPPTMGQAFPEAGMVCGSKKSNLRRCWLVFLLELSFILYIFSSEFCWRRKWQPTPVLLPGKTYGRRSLVGYSRWGRKESDTTERLHFTSLHFWILQIACLISIRFLEFLLFSFFFATEASDLVLATQGNVSVRRQGSSLLYLYPRPIFSCQH